MMRPAAQSSAVENGVETPMDVELQQKVIEGIKYQFGHLVTRIEGFLAVQIGNSGPPLNIHISYKDMINGISLSKASTPTTSSSETLKSSDRPLMSSAPITASLFQSSRKNRRKAYMPMKCEEVSSPPPPPPAHSATHATLLPRSLAPPTSTSSSNSLADDFSQSHNSSMHSSNVSSSVNNLSVETDPMGPLNAESIQAKMNQVMHNSLPVFPMNQFPADIQLPMSIVNTVIPVPQLLGDGSISFGNQIHSSGNKIRLGKTSEQRKIKPKPVSLQGQNAGVVHPYNKPAGTSAKRNPNKEFACNQCTERFKSLNLLTEHTTLVHLCFRCTTCNSKFTQRSNLQRHSLKHLGFKPFKCSICLKEYYRKDHLVRHIEVSHPGSEPKSSILNVMPSADCLRILEETQAQALQDKLAKEAELERLSSAPDTPVAVKSMEPSPSAASPAVSDSAVVNVDRNQPTDLTLRNEGTEDEEAESPLIYGMEIVNDLMEDEDDVGEDLEDELDELEMDLSDETAEDGSLLASSNGKERSMNGDSSMIRLPNPAAESS